MIRAHPALNDEALAQVEPFTVSFHAVARSGLREGDLAVVQGAGPVGLTTIQCVMAAGASELIVIEPGETRSALATELGATHVVHPDNADELVLDRSNGLPVPGVVLRVFLADPDDGSTRRESIWTTGEDGTAVVMMPSSGLGSMAVECPNRLPSEFRVVETISREFQSIAIGVDDLD